MPAAISRLFVIIILSLLLLTACQQQAESGKKIAPLATVKPVVENKIPYGQLGHKVLPVAYELNLSIYPDQEEFSGVVSIELDFTQALDTFYLHGKGLDVSKIEFVAAEQQITATYTQVDPSGIAKIDLSEAVTGAAKITITYSATYNQALEGLYKVSESGKNYAFSQFEAISARLAFPGFDEPGFKTPFTINLNVPQMLPQSATHLKFQLNKLRLESLSTSPLPNLCPLI